MATIRKLPGSNFQTIVRLKNLKPLYASFPTKTKAKQWAKLVDALFIHIATGNHHL